MLCGACSAQPQLCIWRGELFWHRYADPIAMQGFLDSFGHARMTFWLFPTYVVCMLPVHRDPLGVNNQVMVIVIVSTARTAFEQAMNNACGI